jgi:hypothetical protein
MFTNLQSKMLSIAVSIILLLVSNLGSFFYGRSFESDIRDGLESKVEVKRVSGVADAAIAGSKKLADDVEADNEKERVANEELNMAQRELAKYRDENKRLIADRGGLRISKQACTGLDLSTRETKTTSSSGSDADLTGTIALPQEIERGLQDSADEADIILEQFRTLQGWVISQDFYGPPKPKE